jgi:hypothetical protein
MSSASVHSLVVGRNDQDQLVALMLGSTLLIVSSGVFEFQQNLDNCIGESGKTKHLIEASKLSLMSNYQT